MFSGVMAIKIVKLMGLVALVLLSGGCQSRMRGHLIVPSSEPVRYMSDVYTSHWVPWGRMHTQLTGPGVWHGFGCGDWFDFDGDCDVDMKDYAEWCNGTWGRRRVLAEEGDRDRYWSE